MPKTGARSRRRSKGPVLDALKAKMLKRPGFRKVHAETQSVAKVAAKVVEYRTVHHVSQAALAKKAGISRKLVNEIEGLVNTNPSLKTLEALAKALKIPLTKLLG